MKIINCFIKRLFFGVLLLAGISIPLVTSAIEDNKLPIFYAPEHNIDTESALECYTGGWLLPWLGANRIIRFAGSLVHPFNGHKYRDAIELLYARGIVESADIGGYAVYAPDGEVSAEHLQRVHTREYLNDLNSNGRVIGQVLELGPLPNYIKREVLDHVILRPMRFQTRSTEMAVEFAMKNKHNVAVLGGGFHHAKAAGGQGFCVYNDAAIAIEDQWERDRQANRSLTKCMIVDTDAHMGNGNASCFGEKKLACTNRDKTRPVAIFDMYGTERRVPGYSGWYPQYPHDPRAASFITYPHPLKNSEHQQNGKAYLAVLREHLANALAEYKPDLLFYNAGTDVLTGDPLGQFALSEDEIVERDEIVFDLAQKAGVPVVLVTSGGYTSEGSPQAIAASIGNLVKKGYLRPLDSPVPATQNPVRFASPKPATSFIRAIALSSVAASVPLLMGCFVQRKGFLSAAAPVLGVATDYLLHKATNTPFCLYADRGKNFEFNLKNCFATIVPHIIGYKIAKNKEAGLIENHAQRNLISYAAGLLENSQRHQAVL